MAETLPPTAEGVKECAERLRAGKLVAFPTETVYGLGANALDEPAVRDIFACKGRPLSDPLIVHVASVDDALGCIDIDGGCACDPNPNGAPTQTHHHRPTKAK